MRIIVMLLVVGLILSCNKPRYASKSEIRSVPLSVRGEMFLVVQAREKNTSYINWTEIYRGKTQLEIEQWITTNIKNETDLFFKIDSASRSKGIYKQF